jgi:hypothetical protein
MADVRCPMCGKSNQANADTCRFCGGRLKPISNSPGSNPSRAPGPGKPPESDADWLGSLRGQPDQPAGSMGVFVPGPMAQGTSNQDEPENPLNAPDEEFSSWLSRIGAEGPPPDSGELPVEKAPGSSSSGESDDWLANLRDIPAGRESEKNDLYPGGLPGQVSQEDSNWLNRIEPVREELSPEAEFNFDLPKEEAALPDEDLPAWLKELSRPSTPSLLKPEGVPPAPAQLPDWFDNLVTSQPVDETQAKAAGQTSVSASEIAPSSLPPEKAAEISAASQETPGWENEGPDWYAGLPASQAGNRALVESPGGSTWEEQLPDWLSAGKTGEKEEAEAGTIPGPSIDSQTPDWVSDPAASLGLSAANKPEEELAWSTELPDWLSGIAGVESTAQTPQAADDTKTFMPPPTGQEMDSEPPAVEAVLPDWMTNLRPPSASQPTDNVQTPALIMDESPITGEQAEVRPFITEEMPDWLLHLGPPEVIPSVTQSTESGSRKSPASQPGKKTGDEAGLAPADLPNWVQAMRPIETATPQIKASLETDERVENTGPLAGVRGILPGEPLSREIRKPPIYSVKLQVSEKQRGNAALLQSLLAVESEPLNISKVRLFSSQKIYRLVIALVLILGVWVPIWLGGPLTPPPAFLDQETARVKTSIDTIPTNAPVLVAVDYEPGYSGEMETISAGVVAQLMGRSASIVFVSTNPAGPVLANNLLNRAHLQQPAYQLVDKTADLGYLAGGPTALFDFSLAMQSVDPLKASQTADWSKPPLSAVKSLSDFSRVFVLTDNADTARTWVEQVKPSLGQTPLLMVVSAQSAPMISPYLDSGQISGMLLGLTGGALFEQATGQSTAVRGFWDSYQVGLLIIIALILIGGLRSIYNMLRVNRRPRGEA